jgi:hypothetical protein
MSNSTQVVLGAWKNHATGSWTLTLGEKQAGLFSAALLIFLGIVASQAWNIAKFCLHQALTTKTPEDGHHHQIRTVLRNSNGHVHALWLFLQLAFAWRSRIAVGVFL